MDSRPERFRVSSFEFRVLSCACRAGNRHSRINVLLPEPLTPVTQTRRPKGNFTVRFFRLFFEALWSVSQAAFDLSLLTSAPTARRCPRVGYFLCVRKHLPVSDSG